MKGEQGSPVKSVDGLISDPEVELMQALDLDEEDYEVVPHFQRVTISGEDNSGVSIFSFQTQLLPSLHCYLFCNGL